MEPYSIRYLSAQCYTVSKVTTKLISAKSSKLGNSASTVSQDTGIRVLYFNVHQAVNIFMMDTRDLGCGGGGD